ALNCSEVDVIVFRHPSRCWGGATIRGRSGRSIYTWRGRRCLCRRGSWGRRRRCRCRRWCGRRGGAALIHDREELADLDVLAFLARDARDDSALFSADLEIDLLGFELDDRFTDFDAIALLFQP